MQEKRRGGGLYRRECSTSLFESDCFYLHHKRNCIDLLPNAGLKKIQQPYRPTLSNTPNIRLFL